MNKLLIIVAAAVVGMVSAKLVAQYLVSSHPAFVASQATTPITAPLVTDHDIPPCLDHFEILAGLTDMGAIFTYRRETGRAMTALMDVLNDDGITRSNLPAKYHTAENYQMARCLDKSPTKVRAEKFYF